MRKMLGRFDLSDWLAISGIVLLGAGLAMVSVALALSVVGVVLLGLGVWSAARRGSVE